MSEHVAFVIKFIRESNKLTQAELAEELGVTPGHIGSLEQGRAKPSFDVMEDIINKFKIDANMFFGKTQQDVKTVHENLVQLTQNLLSEVSEKVGAYSLPASRPAPEDKN